MVDLDMGQEVEPPPDAKYLAQKNNRAKEETRARDTAHLHMKLVFGEGHTRGVQFACE